jgi:uncharacterized membrane protein YhaH (DUF805 family)
MNKALEVFLSMEGRIPRGLWWASRLVYLLILIPLRLFAGLSESNIIAFIPTIAAIPLICVNGKRFHDRNKSAWWVLIEFIPIIGGLWVLIECGFLAGTPRENRFGLPNIFGNESKMMRTRGSSLRGQRPF